MKEVNTGILTFEEIEDRFPHQWIVITNVNWGNNRNVRFVTAEVKFCDIDYDDVVVITSKNDTDFIHRTYYDSDYPCVEIPSNY